MEGKIFDAEKILAHLNEQVLDPKIATNPTELSRITEELSKTQSLIDAYYIRWSELEQKMKGV